jgi:hypothetical protein
LEVDVRSKAKFILFGALGVAVIAIATINQIKQNPISKISVPTEIADLNVSHPRDDDHAIDFKSSEKLLSHYGIELSDSELAALKTVSKR